MNNQMIIVIVAGMFTILGSILAIIGGVIQSNISNSKDKERMILEKRLLVYEKLSACIATLTDINDDLSHEDVLKVQKSINEIADVRTNHVGSFYLYSSNETLKNIETFFREIDKCLESGYFNEHIETLRNTAKDLMNIIRYESKE